MPIAMYVGQQDPLATPLDTKWATTQLGNVIHYEVMDNFDHGAFTLGLDMSYIERVLKNIAQYNIPTFQTDNIIIEEKPYANLHLFWYKSNIHPIAFSVFNIIEHD